MNKQTEALKMAIEALQNVYFKNEQLSFVDNAESNWKQRQNAIKACKEALEHPMINGLTEAETNETMSVKGLSEQPAQEPYCWCFLDMFLDEEEAKEYEKDVDFSKSGAKAFPLYTHPTPSWQGLSDDEVNNIYPCAEGVHDFRDIVRAIEQELKEKNHASNS